MKKIGKNLSTAQVLDRIQRLRITGGSSSTSQQQTDDDGIIIDDLNEM